MERIVELVDVWAASIEDKPGGMAHKLTALAEAGADLEFLIARRSPDRPGTGVLFVTPLQGDREVNAATTEGFTVSKSMHTVRVEGANEPGLGAKLTQKLAAAKLNLRGMSGAVVGTKYVMHFAFDRAEDARRAMDVLRNA